MASIYIVETGLANIASVKAAFLREGVEVQCGTDAQMVEKAQRVVLPGVGAFDQAIFALRQNRLDTVLQNRIERGAPTLAICLGMQLLGSTSMESPEAQGLGCFKEQIVAFPDDAVTPHFGWNELEVDSSNYLGEGNYVYFAHSYLLQKPPPNWSAAYCTYRTRFVAALQKDAVLACQFHPELSGTYGASILRRWLNAGGR